MDEYMLTTVNKLKNKNYNKLTIVIGNESCDLDSAVSALTYATFLHWQHNQIKCKVCTRNKRTEEVKDDLFVAILNVDREDFNLKTEVSYCLREHGIDETKLVFRNDYIIQDLLTPNTSVVLVDHHVLAGKDQVLASNVSEIIDHRPLDKTLWPYKEDTRSTIEIVGSCATLVVQRIKDLSKLMCKDLEFFKDYPTCVRMLHATIILDTVNFSKEVNKATPHDEEVILFLETFLNFEDSQAGRKKILDRLVDARKDVSGLSAAQLLVKDVKIVGSVFVPSFPILVKEFLQKPESLQAVTAVLAKNNCSIALLLGMELTGGLQRDAAVYSANPDHAGQLAKCLEEWKGPDLQLVREDVSSTAFVYYKQANLSASRKQYMPIVNSFLEVK